MSLGHHKSVTKVYGRHARNLHTGRQDASTASRPSLPRSISDNGPDFGRLRETFLVQGPAGVSDITSWSSTVSSTKPEELESNTLLRTPFPTEAACSEVFKLGDSRPVPDPLGQELSPVPLIREDASDVTATGILVGHPMERGGKIKPITRTLTHSRSKKENMLPKILKASQMSNSKAHISSLGPQKSIRLGLASPFVSRPSSPSSITPHKVNSPQNNVNQNSPRVLRDGHRSGLSDRGPNSGGVPLLPESGSGSQETRSGSRGRHTGHRQVFSQSARTSPTRDDRGNLLANHLRRPSAPSLRHPMAFFDVPSAALGCTRRHNTGITPDDNFNHELEDTALTTHVDSYVDFFERSSETYFASSLGTVDFNRPPSQMSVHALEMDNEYAGDNFFAHILGRSTPHRKGRFLDLLDPTSDTSHGPDDRNDRTGLDTAVHAPSSEVRSPWISDSIISPPSYYDRREDERSLEDNTTESALDEMNYARSPSHQGVVPALITSAIDTVAAISHAVGIKEPRLKPTLPKLRTLGLSVTQPALNTEPTRVVGGDNKNVSPRVQQHCEVVARNGTLSQGSSTDGRTAGRRNRSDTIVPGGGGARRTRSGTVVQANRIKRMQSTNSGDDELQEEGDTRDELCSCCSSDDELLLRSHSHFDVEAVDLAWKVAEPPSPVQRRLRRAERMYEKKKKRRENGRNSHLRKAVEGIEEDGMEDLGVDELDLLGTFLPEEW